MFPEAVNEDYGLKLTVHGTGILDMDQFVLHPFVRIHVVDMQTCKYLAKTEMEAPGIANKESVNFFQMSKELKEKNPLMSQPDFLLPMSTNMYDLRVKGVNFCEWNEEFIINERVQELMKPKVMILFEILEFNTQLVLQNSSQLNSDKLYPVAWAYLRPLGAASIHMDKVKLQLYRYRWKSDMRNKFNRPIDPRTPDVLLELNWQQKVKFNSFLEVELQFCNYKSTEVIPRQHFSRAPWEKEIGTRSYTGTLK